jgi:Domain of unknown function (DUF4394)/Calx-beta domain
VANPLESRRTSIRPDSPARFRVRYGQLLFAWAAVIAFAGLPTAVRADTAYALTSATSSQILVFDTATPGAVLSTLTISGLRSGETLLAIDLRPSTGELYGLGSTSRLYVVDTATGLARQVGAAPFAPALSGTAFGFDFFPMDLSGIADHVRVVSDSGQNLRVDADTGVVQSVDTDLTPPGDVVGSAYSDNIAPPPGHPTTLYGIDFTSDQLVLQTGADFLDLHAITPIGSLGVDTTREVGFDIGVANVAYASLDVGGLSRLYRISLDTGAASLVGAIGSGATIRGLAVRVPVTVGLFGVTGNNVLLYFPSAAPSFIVSSAPIVGLRSGESVLGLDIRPATGDLYALGSTGQLYRIPAVLFTATAQATAIGVPFSTRLVGTAFGFNFDPTTDRIRVVSDAGQNLQIDPNTGEIASVDAPLRPPGMIVAAAYTNNVAGAAVTTLYDIDVAAGRLLRQGGPNGSPSPALGELTVVGSLGIHADAAAFDIAAVDGTAYASLDVEGRTGLYEVNLVNGAARFVGQILVGHPSLVGLTAQTPGRVRFTQPTYFAPEAGAAVTISLTRTGGAAGLFSVAFAATGGTATAGVDYTITPDTLVFDRGQSTASFTVTLLEDALDEADETIVLSLSNASAGGSIDMPSTAVLTLLDDDGPDLSPTVSITSPASPAFAAHVSFITLAGVASDDIDVASVTWASDRGGSGRAAGTTTWTANDIPLFVGPNVITVQAFDAQGQSGIDTITISVNALSYTLAEGATGTFFDLDLLLANPNSVAVPVDIVYLKSDGTPVGQSLTLGPTSRTTVLVDSIPGLEAAEISSTVTATSGLPIIVERTMRWDSTGYGSHTEKATAGPASRWYFAEGAQGFFHTFYLLANASETSNQVTLQFLLETGTSVTRTYTLSPTSRLTIYAGGIPELVDQSFGATVTFAVPGVAERAMYFGTPIFDGGHASAGVNAPATSWFLAEGATGSFFTTCLLLANPGDTAANVTVTYLTGSGIPVTTTRTIAGRQRLTINVADEDPALAHVAVATHVASSVPIVAERVQYWPFSPGQWREAHNSFGVTATGTRWGLAEGRVGGAAAYLTYVLLANPGSTAANVTLRFLRTNGTTVLKTLVVPPTSRQTVSVGPGTLVPELMDEDFGVVIDSDQPIAVERALYSNANGTLWAAGSDATATRLP